MNGLYIPLGTLVIIIFIIIKPMVLWQHGTIGCSPIKRARRNRITGKVQYRCSVDEDWENVGWEEWHNFEPYK